MISLLLKFLPGANLLAIPAAIAQFVGQVIKWTWKGIEDCFTHPATFLVCAAFSIGGAYGMAKYIGHRVSDLRSELVAVNKKLAAAETERNQWRQRASDQQDRADEAVAARKKAEDDAKSAVVPQPAPVGRVYRRSSAAPVKPAGYAGSWVPRF